MGCNGFKDNRTAAELQLAPAKPLLRNTAVVGNLHFGAAPGAISSGVSLSSATHASVRDALAAKSSLSTLSSSMTDSLQQFDAQSSSLLSGRSFNADTSVFGLASTATVQAGGFFSASDLTQMSGMKAGALVAGSIAAVTLLARRKKKLVNLTARVGVALSAFSIAGALVKENYNRTPYPLEEDLDLPNCSRLAQGDEAAQADPILIDKRKFTRTGIGVAVGKPSTWTRHVTSRTDLLKGFTALPGFSSALNMVFKDRKNQQTWSEPATPYAAEYPSNKATQTESGHAVEFDDTPGAERIHVFHRSGSCVEMHPDGKVVTKLMGGGYIVAEADLHVSVKGVCHISVDGDANIYTKGKLDLQGDEGINIHTKKDFNVFAKNINLRAKAKSTLDGTIIDLRYVTLPGIPVVTTSGIAPTLNMAAMKKDFPEIHGQVCKAVLEHKVEMARLKAGVIAKNATIETKAALQGAAIGPTQAAAAVAEGAAMIAQNVDTMAMILKLQSGIFPTGTAPKFEFPALTAEQEPVENPLGNPLAYIATTSAAATYRTLFFDTPQEMGDVELYQAHQQTQLLLGDIESVEPKLGGAKTTPVTGIVAPASLPIVNYLDRDTYRGNFSSDPGQTLGGTSFTYGELVDSLSRADVANPHITEPVTI